MFDGPLELPGRRLSWRSAGEGRPLLLLNGYAATAADWDPTFVEALTKCFRIISPDHRGMGDSTWGTDDEPLTIESMAADAEALLDHLSLGPAAVVGWSMGGFVAQRLALGAPTRVTAMALLSTDPGGPDAVLPPPEVRAQLADASGSPREQATRLLQLLFPAPVAARVDQEVGDLVAAARAELDPHVLVGQDAAIAAWYAEVPPPLPPDPPPVLVVAGDVDVVVPPANAALLAERWPGARVERFADAGHAVMAEYPTEVADLLTEFLAR